MMRHDYSYVKNYINSLGYKLISSEYNNSSEKLKMLCDNEHLCEISFSNFKHGKTRCRKCTYINRGINKRLNQKDVTDYIESFGYKVHISYTHNDNKIQIECPNQHIYYTKFSTFKNGHRCLLCSSSKKYSYEDVLEFFSKENYTLISDNYLNTHQYLTVKCDKNHIYKTKLNNFLMGRRCRKCSIISKKLNRSLDDVDLYKSRGDRTKFLLKHVNKDILINDPNYESYKLNKKLYEVDHIFPRIAFVDYNIDNYPELVLELCNDIKNLRIILKTENRSKHSKYNKDDFFNYLKNFK